MSRPVGNARIGLIFMIKGGGDKSPLVPYVSPGLSFSGVDDAMIQTEKKK